MSDIQFDEIDGQGVQHVLRDLTLVKANGPNCSSDSQFQKSREYIYHFKVDSEASGNLLPLCVYREIFPSVTQAELEQSIDHRVPIAGVQQESHQTVRCVLSPMLRTLKAIQNYVSSLLLTASSTLSLASTVPLG